MGNSTSLPGQLLVNYFSVFNALRLLDNTLAISPLVTRQLEKPVVSIIESGRRQALAVIFGLFYENIFESIDS